MVEVSPLPTGFPAPIDAAVLPVIEAPIAVATVAEPEIVVPPADLRAALRAAHCAREAATRERDQVTGVLEKARRELQRLSDTQRDRELAHEAEVTKFVQARAAALLDGTENEIAWPASSDDTELLGEITAARAVEEQLAGKLREAETVLRRAEAKVTDAAIAVLVDHGEKMAIEVEAAEASARDKRASLRRLGELWVRGGGRLGPVPLGRKALWVLGDGNINAVEAVIGLRSYIAAQRGHVLLPEQPPPAWDLVLSALLIDPEAEVP